MNTIYAKVSFKVRCGIAEGIVPSPSMPVDIIVAVQADRVREQGGCTEL